MVKRFIERFQIWRQERVAESEDRFLAFLLFLFVLFAGQDIYTLITTHHVTWSNIFDTTLMLFFTMLYFRRSRWAWLILMLYAIDFLVTAVLSMLALRHPAPGTGVPDPTFMLVLGLAAFLYSLIIRKRFARGTPTI